MKNELYEKLKKSPELIDVYVSGGGKHISDFDVDKLAIKTLPSGFRSLDEYMLLKESEGELVIIGGRPSSGKSGLMFQIALNVSKDYPVHVFSLEMGQLSIDRRLTSQLIGRSISEIQNNQVERSLL